MTTSTSNKVQTLLDQVPFLDNPLFIPAVSLLLVLLIYVVYKSAFGSSSKNKGTVLLLGSLDSGKTSILSSLIYSQSPQTHTSLQPNTSTLPVPIPTSSNPSPKKQTAYTLVDIPGHPRLRPVYLSHLPSTHTILFVIDSSTIARSTSPGASASVAEYLHQVMYQLAHLSEEAAKKGRKIGAGDDVKLVLVAHKADLINLGSGAASYASAVAKGGPGSGSEMTAQQAKAKGEIAINRVRSILERELTKRANDLRTSVSIEGLGSDASSAPGAGGDQGVIDSSSGLTGLECIGSGAKGGEGFKFANWEYGEVEFLSSWVEVDRVEFVEDMDSEGVDREKAEEKQEEKVDGEDGLGELKEWLNQNL